MTCFTTFFKEKSTEHDFCNFGRVAKLVYFIFGTISMCHWCRKCEITKQIINKTRIADNEDCLGPACEVIADQPNSAVG